MFVLQMRKPRFKEAWATGFLRERNRIQVHIYLQTFVLNHTARETCLLEVEGVELSEETWVDGGVRVDTGDRRGNRRAQSYFRRPQGVVTSL